MCGIVGCKSVNAVVNDMNRFLLDGLKKLEYRGYDSWGMCVLNGKMHVLKNVGKVGTVVHNEDLSGVMGMAHTRWATHGGVTDNNAHPHLSCDGSVAVVHNGIIENYRELKDRLSEKGHIFNSETDTEVLSHLIEEYMKTMHFKEATMTALRQVDGHYAICVISDKSNEMIAARRGSPLVVGLGDGEYYIASDIPAFLDKTKNVVYLHDNDFVVIDNDMKIYNLVNDAVVKRPVDTIQWDIEQVKKGEFEHYMLKEISEQFETLKKTISQDSVKVREFSEAIKNSHNVVLVASGTSYHACLGARYFFSKVSRRNVHVIPASEYKHYASFFGSDATVIAVTQSGETADVLDAIREAKMHGARILSITNVMGSSVTRYSDSTIYLNAGPEICVLATKSYTSQLAATLLLAHAIQGNMEHGKAQVEYARNELYNLTARSTRDHIGKLASIIKDTQHMFIIGRGINHSSALEAALKIKEVSYMHAEGFAGGELKHGTIALIEKGTPCIVITGKDDEKETLSNAQELKARGAYIIGVAPENHDVFDFFIKVPECGIANPIVHAIPMQILAYQLAVLRGHDPDKPRNLAKSVTVR